MTSYLAGVDVGTTGVRCVIFDIRGNIVASDYCEYGSIFPKPGWVEQDGNEIVTKTKAVCKSAIVKSQINPKEIGAIGFSTQRSVTIPVDKDGKLVRPMISWQDARTTAEVEEMNQLIAPQIYHNISGVPIGTPWLITKVMWMRKHEPKIFEKVAKFVQHQDFMLRAFGVDAYYTDLSGMVLYGVWDINAITWSEYLCRLFDVYPSLFGIPQPAGTQVGTISPAIANETGFAVGTPICVGAGDQSCAMIGMGSIQHGMATVNLGTAGVAIISLDKPILGQGGLTIANHPHPGLWDAEGVSLAAASAYRWFRDTIGTLEKERETHTGNSAYDALNTLASTAPVGSKGLLFLPYLATAGTPHWNASARAAFLGLSLAHGRGELVRSVLEGVALEMRDIMAVWQLAGVNVESIRLGGGATKSTLWNHIQADVYGRLVQTLKIGESTVLGAAILGGVGAGIFGSIAEGVAQMVTVTDTIEPNMVHHKIYEEMYQAYIKAYEGLTNSEAFNTLARLQSA